MTFDDPGASKDCARKRAHTEKVVNGIERVKLASSTINYIQINGVSKEFGISMRFYRDLNSDCWIQSPKC